MNRPRPLHARLLSSVADVDAEQWNALLRPGDPPVLDWHWFHALEESGTASAERGWRPAHIALFEGAALLAVCPLYIRESADGEFVWSGPILQACTESGLPFAPRGVGTIPATPVPSRRILSGTGLAREDAIALVGQTLIELMGAERLASVGLHFCAPDEVAVLARSGWILRRQWQYRWSRQGEAGFDEFLGRFKARRRASIRRERRELAAAGVRVELVGGADAPDPLFESAGVMYRDTAARHGTDPLIAASFFSRVASSPLRDRLVLGVARDTEGICGITFNVRDTDTLYGRTWGATRGRRFLHFEAAYYAGIDWCLQQGLQHFEPGHGGEYKKARGFDARAVESVHAFADRRLHAAIHAWAGRERDWVDERLAAGL